MDWSWKTSERCECQFQKAERREGLYQKLLPQGISLYHHLYIFFLIIFSPPNTFPRMGLSSLKFETRAI